MHNEITVQPVELESPTKKRYDHGQYPCRGMYHRPSGIWPKTAIIASHYVGDTAMHFLAEYMARRGYGFLGFNTRYVGATVALGFNLENALIDLGAGVRWLREVADVENVVILGFSGGASFMGTYQAQALDPHIDAGSAPAEELEKLLPADFYISLAAHTGRADIACQWLDPSVTDENDPLSRNPDLDMYNPQNGPPYSEEFLARYRQAQIDRNDRITDWAEHELARIRDGRPDNGAELEAAGVFGAKSQDGVYDRFFSVPRQFADPRFLDLSLDPSKRPVGCYMGDALASNYSGYGFSAVTSLRDWLSMWSRKYTQVRSENQLPRIKNPALVISADHDVGCFPSHAQAIFDGLGSQDKQLVTVDGGHYIQSPGDRDEVADLMAGWLSERGALAS